MTQNKVVSDTGWKLENSYAQLPEVFYTKSEPTPVRDPKLVVVNEPLAQALGLDAGALRSDRELAVLAGNSIAHGSQPLAQAYAGHQFGHFNRLGDGRAILLGEQITPQDERYDIQLKGSGRTQYSRGGDGRAALGPMLREYIMSEAMHALGIPTTRSLAVVATGEPVYRETELPGAILTRVAGSHIRVGTFQYAAAFTTVEELRALADYTIERHYPEAKDGENRYLALLQGVIQRQLRLITQWQGVGFIHGVMNTDNMALSGETIDYGPCAFMDNYDPATVFSSIDTQGRYAYGNQPRIAGWNLARLAEALLPLLHEEEEKAVELAQAELNRYGDQYQGQWLMKMRAKLGLLTEETDDEALVDRLLHLMHQHRADFTNTFRALTIDQPQETTLHGAAEFDEWYKEWKARLGRQPDSMDASRQIMQQHNPVVIPRNHRVEEALDAAVTEGDYSVMERLLTVLAKPYDYDKHQDAHYTQPSNATRPYRTFCGT